MDQELEGTSGASGNSAGAMMKRLVKYWGVRLGIFVIFVIFTLLHLHIITNHELLIVALSAIIWFLSEQLNLSDEQHKREMEMVSARIDSCASETKSSAAVIAAQAGKVQDLIDTTSVNLLSLHDCALDLDKALRLIIDPGQRVIIEHLALDMTHAWDFFERMLRTHPNLIDIEYRLLMLTDETDKLAGAPKEVRAWSQSVPGTMERIQKDIATLYNEAEHRHRKVNFEIRKYSSIPVVHGFRVVQPNIRCFIAICRWGEIDHERYDWGDGFYHRIIGFSNIPSGQDMLKIFDRYFRHFWKLNETTFKFENPKNPTGNDRTTG